MTDQNLSRLDQIKAALEQEDTNAMFKLMRSALDHPSEWAHLEYLALGWALGIDNKHPEGPRFYQEMLQWKGQQFMSAGEITEAQKLSFKTGYAAARVAQDDFEDPYLGDSAFSKTIDRTKGYLGDVLPAMLRHPDHQVREFATTAFAKLASRVLENSGLPALLPASGLSQGEEQRLGSMLQIAFAAGRDMLEGRGEAGREIETGVPTNASGPQGSGPPGVAPT